MFIRRPESHLDVFRVFNSDHSLTGFWDIFGVVKLHGTRGT